MSETEDWVKQGHFRVIDRRKIKRFNEKDDFHINVIRANGVIGSSTWHKDEQSMLKEVANWLKRGAKPEGIEAFNATVKINEQHHE